MKNQKNIVMSVSVALLLAILAVGSVQAEPYGPVWQSNAGGCVPEDPSIEQNIHFTVTGGMRVKFRAGKTGTIKLTCPVTVPFSGAVGPILSGQDAIGLVVYYQDPDGQGSDYQVKAHLQSVRLSDGAFSTLCTTDSNRSDSSAQWSKMGCGPGVHLGEEHVYWVQIELMRQSTSKTVEISVIMLEKHVG